MSVLKGAVVGLLTAHIALAVPCAFGTEKARVNVRLLSASPLCVERRLGVVSVTLGTREPNPRYVAQGDATKKCKPAGHSAPSDTTCAGIVIDLDACAKSAVKGAQCQAQNLNC